MIGCHTPTLFLRVKKTLSFNFEKIICTSETMEGDQSLAVNTWKLNPVEERDILKENKMSMF